MNNSIIIVDDGTSFLWVYFVWLSFFFIIALPNLLVVVTIVRYPALRGRKEYLVVAGLCFADFLDITTGYGLIALYRIIVIYKGMWSVKTSVWSCLVSPFFITCWIGTPFAALMLCVVSVDRLFCVLRPMKYFATTTKYTHRMIGSVFLFCTVNALAFIALGFANRHESHQMTSSCLLGILVPQMNSKYFKAYYFYTQPMGAFFSVLLYCCVGVIFMKKNQVSLATDDAEERHQQRKVTKSLALCTLCTTIFVILPILLANVGPFIGLTMMVHQMIWFLPPMNPLFNVVILIKRQKQVKKGIQALLKNKQMPVNLNLWN